MEKCVASMEWIGWHGATQHKTRQDCVGLFVVLMGGVHTTTWFVDGLCCVGVWGMVCGWQAKHTKLVVVVVDV